jgi:hypothetical protein
MATSTDGAAPALALETRRVFSLCAALANPAELVQPLTDVGDLKAVKPFLAEMGNNMNPAEYLACLICFGAWFGWTISSSQ